VIADHTPVVVGVGEWSERIDMPDYRALSPVEMAAEAARRACKDAGGNSVNTSIDVIVGLRQFEAMTPTTIAPFGRADNFPRAVAKRLGLHPARAVLEVLGGQAPQHLVGEFCGRIAKSEARTVLLMGSESMSTVRHLKSRGETRDWSEKIEGQLEDRGMGSDNILSEVELAHGVVDPPQVYALLENARRARLSLSRSDYAVKQMGSLFAPFTEVAARNPHAASRDVFTAEQLATPSERNRMIADPYTRQLVARDQVNQAAAVLVTSVGEARRLGIPEAKWVFLHGYADLEEKTVLKRADLSRSPAAVAACRAALESAGVGVPEIDVFELYSCFPIAVLNIADGLGLALDDPRGFTVTGGLPYFGGPGNNFAMHSIAEMVPALRARPGSFGLVGANGGYMSKYSAGVYSTTPVPWTPCDSKPVQARLDAADSPAIAAKADGWGRIESYTIAYDKGAPARAIIVGRLENGDQRFMATTAKNDGVTVATMVDQEPIGQRVFATSGAAGNRFSFSAGTSVP